jgi:hypothetical protein
MQFAYIRLLRTKTIIVMSVDQQRPLDKHSRQLAGLPLVAVACMRTRRRIFRPFGDLAPPRQWPAGVGDADGGIEGQGKEARRDRTPTRLGAARPGAEKRTGDGP